MVDKVEHYNSYAKVRFDLFNFIDVIAIMPDQVGTLGIQATTASNLSSRVRKVVDDPVLRQRARWYVGQGNRLLFWGWKQDKTNRKWDIVERDFAEIDGK